MDFFNKTITFSKKLKLIKKDYKKHFPTVGCTVKHMEPTKWGWRVWYPCKLHIGKNVDIGSGTKIFAHKPVVIHDDVKIGADCRIYTLSTERYKGVDGYSGMVVLKRGCSVGTNSTIMPKITIGKGARVGAHCFITDDVPDGCTIRNASECIRD